MKRLFKVKADGKFKYFNNKVEAKAFRDEHPGSHVSKGPDHMGNHGHKHHKRENKS